MSGIRTRHLPAADRPWLELDEGSPANVTELVERRPATRPHSRDASLTVLTGTLGRVPSSASLAGARPSARRSMVLGGAALVVCIFSFVAQTIITRSVQESYVQPYFILWVSHSFWVIILPLHTVYEKLKRRPRSLAALKLETLVASAKLIVQRRRSHTGSRLESSSSFASDLYEPVNTTEQDDADMRCGATTGDEDGSRALATSRPGWVVWRMIGLTAMLAGLLNSSAYLWYVAVGFTSMSKVTAIYNMSCFFAYLFSILLLKERVQVVKCVAVGISIVGVALMALFDTGADVQALTEAQRHARRNAELLGDLLSLACACGIGLYQVLYKKYAVPKDYHSLYHVNFMTALLGASTLLVFWMPIPALHVIGIERFRWPDGRQFAFIASNAMFGVAYNAGFMIALALTSPLFAAVGVMLTIPAMAAVDMVIQGHALAWSILAGAGAILAGFATLTYAEYCDSVRKTDQTADSSSSPPSAAVAPTTLT
ncbi:hypothetical protein GGI19_002061 [Coemansia pectinata]|uniref:EamA domain-containing protein n=1 Tax=Coemansia pectinata TaxID=1052879 RepID=A0A9W8LBL5_9FUNG|nr:hypothetical protein GGI19_002061 [Coemansia pectinata]